MEQKTMIKKKKYESNTHLFGWGLPVSAALWDRQQAPHSQLPTVSSPQSAPHS